ncbi:hypothetical protein V8C44DRAFT_326016 [Trichoderma aethiopicum]
MLFFSGFSRQPIRHEHRGSTPLKREKKKNRREHPPTEKKKKHEGIGQRLTSEAPADITWPLTPRFGAYCVGCSARMGTETGGSMTTRSRGPLRCLALLGLAEGLMGRGSGTCWTCR